MFTPPTYRGFLVVALLPLVLALLALAWRRLRRPLVAGTGLVALVGLLYTIPWDNALIARGVWWYGDGTVLATLHFAPVEEYLFVLLQVVLTALWVALLRGRFDREVPTRDDGEADWTAVSRRDRLVGVAAGLLVGGVGVALLTVEATFYAGAILAWAAPVLAVQWAFGWPHLWRNRRLTALAVGVPTVYLAAADRVAIELGLWSLSPRYTTGVLVAGLPVEEGAFFLVTNVFVVQGLLLFLWVVDPAAGTSTRPTDPLASNP